MNQISQFIKAERKKSGLTQEQGKETCRMDKVNQALAMFGCTLGVVKNQAPEN